MLLSFQNEIAGLCRKHGKGEKIRVGFGVVFDGMFPMASVFDLMRRDEFFDPFIVVVPDAMRGWKHEIEQMYRTKKTLEDLWPDANILFPFSPKAKAYKPVSDFCDLWCPANPYDIMTRPQYTILEFAKRGVPSFFTGYGFTVSQWYCNVLAKKGGLYSLFWKIYAANRFEYDAISAGRPDGSCVISGYPKMDALAGCIPQISPRKKIIMAPHHTVNRDKGHANFSNFLRYSDFFLDLPARYPEIDFVFRPHPLLFTTLSGNNIWDEDKCAAYLQKMESCENVETQLGGQYLQTFADADAIIHDCGSFTAEWLYTGKPGCYMLKDPSLGEYNSFAKKCLDAYAIALSENDITDFIEKTVLGGIDGKAEIRRRIRDEIAVNYPKASETILADLKTSITNSCA